MLLEAMEKKLKDHRHFTTRKLSPMDKELKHVEEFRIKWVTPSHFWTFPFKIDTGINQVYFAALNVHDKYLYKS